MSDEAPQQIRVLHVLRSAHVGGIEKLVAQLVDAQSRDPALRVAVLFVMSKRGKFREHFPLNEIDIAELDIQSGYSASPAGYRHAKKLFRQFDVLHFHTFHPLVALAAARGGAEVLYTEHGNFGFGRRVTASDRVKAILLGIFLRRIVARVSFNSRFTEAEARRRYRLKPENGSVVYNGIDLSEKGDTGTTVSDEIANELRGKFIVGTSTRFAGFKRVDRLIAGFEMFSRNKDDVALLLVGDGDLRTALEYQVAGLGIEAKTIFAGYQVDVSAFQSLMHVCVFPSRFEPFGLVALEAYELGKPTVVFEDGGGLLEIVGGLDPSDIVADINGLAERLDFYYLRQDDGAQNSARRSEYVKIFDIRKVACEFKTIYQQIAKCAA